MAEMSSWALSAGGLPISLDFCKASATMKWGPDQYDSDGFPPRNDDVFEADFADDSEPRPPRQRAWLGVVLILLMIGIVVGPLLFTGFSDELARWRLAAAWEQRLDGDLDAAIASLDAALEQNPDNVELLLQRARWEYENEEFEAALEDCNRAADVAPDDPRMLFQRSQVYQELQRWDESVADFERLLDTNAVNRWVALNGLAYARAVAAHAGGADQDLDRALNEIDEALSAGGQDPAMLDTRGFIQFQRGEWDEALDDMNLAVRAMEAEYEERQSMLDEARAVTVDLRQEKLQLADLAKSVAVLRYHRALVHEVLGDTDKADADYARVRELGFEPEPGLF